jgi:hypothetical protein
LDSQQQPACSTVFTDVSQIDTDSTLLQVVAPYRIRSIGDDLTPGILRKRILPNTISDNEFLGLERCHA